MTRAAPFGGLFAGDYFRHFQEKVDDGADSHGELGSEKDAALGNIVRFGSLLRDGGFADAKANGSSYKVAGRYTTVPNKTVDKMIHEMSPGTKGGGLAQN